VNTKRVDIKSVMALEYEKHTIYVLVHVHSTMYNVQCTLYIYVKSNLALVLAYV
jgi:hypothetical protein